MDEIREMVRRWGPELVNLLEKPYWICLYGSPTEPGAHTLEFWVGVGFDDWHPRPGCLAIIAVLSATSVLDGASPARQRLVCGVAESGAAYAVMTLTDNGRLIEGVPSGGRLLDAIRSKFGLPPGPSSSCDLETEATRPKPK